MGKKRYLKIFLPLLLIVIMGSVTSCFLFFMDWSGGLEGDWIYHDDMINETVFLTIGKNSVEMVFDEDNPYYPINPILFSTTTAYFNDWGFKGNLFVDEDAYRMDITINQLYRYYSKWYTTYITTPYTTTGNWEYIRGGWYTSGGWPWTTYPYTNYFYNNFLSNFPGGTLGASGNNITCDYHLDGDSLTLTFDPGVVNRTFEFHRD